MSRLAIEIKAGVFVASISARVRDILWEKIQNKWNLDALMIYTTNREQGYAIRSHGDPSREIIDCDGACLLARTFVRKTTKARKISDKPEYG